MTICFPLAWRSNSGAVADTAEPKDTNGEPSRSAARGCVRTALRLRLGPGLAADATGGRELREQTARIDVDATVDAPAIAAVGDTLAGKGDLAQLREIAFDLGVADLRKHSLVCFVLAVGYIVRIIVAPDLRGGDFLFELFRALLQQLLHVLK